MAFSLCSATTANTGEVLCDVSRGVLKKLFIFNDAFDASDYADETTFEAAMVAASKLSKNATGKLFPVPEAQEITDNSEANREGTLGLGFSAVLLEGKPKYTIKAFAGTALVKALRKFNNQTIRVMEYDANNRVWGTQSGTDFKGFKAKLFFTGSKLATGQNVEEGIVTFTLSILDTSEYFDSAKYMPADNVTDVEGLLDVTLYEISHATNVWKIGIKYENSQMGGSINMYDDYSAALVVGLWKATVVATGADLPITSVAVDATLKAWTVTFDSTAYTALASGAKIQLELVAPQTLDAADVTEIESIPVILTK